MKITIDLTPIVRAVVGVANTEAIAARARAIAETVRDVAKSAPLLLAVAQVLESVADQWRDTDPPDSS